MGREGRPEAQAGGRFRAACAPFLASASPGPARAAGRGVRGQGRARGPGHADLGLCEASWLQASEKVGLRGSGEWLEGGFWAHLAPGGRSMALGCNPRSCTQEAALDFRGPGGTPSNAVQAGTGIVLVGPSIPSLPVWHWAPPNKSPKFLFSSTQCTSWV